MADRPVSVGLLGAGFAATAHCRAYAECTQPPARVVAVAAQRRGSAAALAARFHIPYVEEDATALLARPDLEAIDICTPNRSHLPLALAAVRRGLPVLVEKPLTGYFGPEDASAATPAGAQPRSRMLAEALEGADALLQAAKAAGVPVAYGENLVFSPVVHRVKELLGQANATILEIRASECHSGSHAAYAKRWREAGGGALLRLGSHPIGLALHLKRDEGTRRAGKPIEVAAVSAEVARLPAGAGADAGFLVNDWEDVENWSATTLRFTDGSHAICLASDLALGGIEDELQVLTARARFKANFTHSSLLQVYAPTGDVFSAPPLQEKSHTNAGWSFPEVDTSWLYGFRAELQDFVAAVQEKRPPLADGHLGRAVVEAIYAAYLSAAEGRRVALRPGA